MIIKTSDCELVTKRIGQDVVIITRNDSDVKFKEVATDIPLLYMSLNRSINISNSKLKQDCTTDVVLTNLPIIVCCPDNVLLRINRIPKLYFVNLIYEFDKFAVGSCLNLEDVTLVLSNYVQYQRLSIKLTIDKLIYRNSIIKPNQPIAELDFITNGRIPVDKIYVIENDELYRQFFITNKRENTND